LQVSDNQSLQVKSVVKDRLLKANHNEKLYGSSSACVVKDRLLKANHNMNELRSSAVKVVKDRLLKANHNSID